MPKMNPSEARAAILAGTAPDGLSVGGWLYLCGCTGLTALPDGLSVGGSLDLGGCTGLTALPDGLSVGGWLDLSGCTGPGKTIYRDRKRGYKLWRVRVGEATWYAAGCRLFRSAADALAHWGGDDYPNKACGARYCAAIRKAEAE